LNGSTNLRLADSYAAHCTKLHIVVLGDCDKDGNCHYWLVLPADAARLEKAGYEIL
jgi:hypothetical protein